MSDGPKIESKKKFTLPHIYILLFGIIAFCTILTYIVPAGQFDRVKGANGTEMAVAGSWHTVKQTPVSVFHMFQSLFTGMNDAAGVIFFVFISFASVAFITKSGAFDGLVVWLMKVLKGNATLIVIPIFMALFGLGSSTVGMFEEWLPFIPIFAAIFIRLGFDAITGLATVALGAGLGFSGAAMNPFTVGVSQGIAQVPYMSGAGYRIICHVVMWLISSLVVMRYAKKVKEKPEKSLVYGDDFSELLKNDEGVDSKVFGIRQKLVLLDLLIGIVVIVYGTKKFGWYFTELSAVFVIMGLIAAIIMGTKINHIGEDIAVGFKDAAMAAMMIGIARAILMVLNEGKITDTIVYGMSMPLSHLPAEVSAVAMLIVQTILNFFIPSGSGQAAVSMPIMTPLADMLGITRNTACLAFQFGDGLSNIVWPTAFAPIMAGLAGVKVEKWWKFIFPLFFLMIAVQAVLMVVAVMSGFGK